jgi:uncharacterized protein (DUF952 family)
MTNKSCIFHIANLIDIDTINSNDDYQCDSLTSEGFIHCCDRHQLAGVVSRYYQDIDVVLLVLDVEALEPALIHENTVGGSELFPHVYGVINRSAIVDVIAFGINSIEREGLYS